MVGRITSALAERKVGGVEASVGVGAWMSEGHLISVNPLKCLKQLGFDGFASRASRATELTNPFGQKMDCR
jgi:hypothetical protein